MALPAPMRIYGPNGSNAAASISAPRRPASGTFRIGDDDAVRTSSPALAVRTIGGIEALMTLQGVEEPRERRRRAVRRGRAALDALDALKLGVLGGNLDPRTLARLKSVAAQLTEVSGDPGLDAVLAEIALRVAVELAKFEPRHAGDHPRE